jgi:hypothetical protein
LDLRKASRLLHPPDPPVDPIKYVLLQLKASLAQLAQLQALPPLPLMNCFPLMPQLSIIQIGITGCLTISLNDLVDAAPNLLTLEISGSGCDICDLPISRDNGSIWKGSPELLKTHNLKCLKSGVSMRDLGILRKTVQKFPNLHELWIGHEGEHPTSLKMDDVFELLKDLKSLKRFKWTALHSFVVAEVLKNFANAANGIPSMESCHVRFIRWAWDPNLFPDLESDSFFENRDELLKNILGTKDAHCNFLVTTNCPHYFETESKPSTEDVGSAKKNLVRTFGVLLPYIKQHGLPIEFKYSPTTDQDA